MAMLEIFPQISDANGKPVMLMPLSFVVLVSMIKDIFEDLKRHKSDNQENNKKTRMGNPSNSNQFEECVWRKVEVGRIIKVMQD